MKPKEFDELIRQKFDQNDFAYKSGSWDLLAEKLEGRAKKRSMLVWWWMPLAGMAASVALAMGSASLIRHSIPAQDGVQTEMAQTYKSPQSGEVNNHTITIVPSAHKEEVLFASVNKNSSTKTNSSNKHDQNTSDWVHVRLNETAANETPAKTTVKENNEFNFLAANNNNDNKVRPKVKKEEVIVKEGYNTFKDEEDVAKKMPKVSITLLGGYSQGGQNTGYMAGAAIRRMLNDKVYIESDVAFASSNNSQSTQYATYVSGPGKSLEGKHPEGKNSGVEAGKAPTTTVLKEVITTEQQNYNLYYAQVSPSIGYKVIKKLAIGVGPDFQQMLADNRPATSNVERGNIQVAPLFDVGFIGKTELMVTKRVKAAVSYRKGINNILTPMDKYIDRDYLQFQIRCTIFNK